MSIVLKGEFTTLNDYNNLARTHWSKAHEVKRQETERVYYEIMSMKEIDTPQFPADLVFEWHTKSRADHDNIAFAKKFILDGLVLAHVLPDDNPSFVCDLADVFIEDADPFVVIYIEPHNSLKLMR